MAGNKLTLKLTKDQQNQIKAATGQNVTELNIDFASTGQLSDHNLDQVAGGMARAGGKQVPFMTITLS